MISVRRVINVFACDQVYEISVDERIALALQVQISFWLVEEPVDTKAKVDVPGKQVLR
jgi:hypothetical protein